MGIRKFFGNWIVRNLIWAVLIVAALVTGSYFLLQVITKHNQELTVPDLTGMSVEDAGKVAAAHGMRIEVTDSIYVRRMERGTVYRHTPGYGKKVKKGRRLLLTINAVNPKSVTMPNLIGYSTRQAKAELSSRGLNLGRLIYVDDIATNNVLKQLYGNREIDPGTKVESESVIDLVVGLNSSDNMTFVPYLIGARYLSAVDAVHDRSLNIRDLVFDNTVRDYADSIGAVVYRQIPDTSSVPCLMGNDVTLYLTTDMNKVKIASATDIQSGKPTK